MHYLYDIIGSYKCQCNRAVDKEFFLEDKGGVIRGGCLVRCATMP